jgi:hypothetical protein
VTIPARIEELTAAWFSGILGRPVTGVEILDAHSGTTGESTAMLSAYADEARVHGSFPGRSTPRAADGQG